MSLKDRSVGFVGGGAMAEALIGGLIAAGVPARAIRVAEPEAARREHIARVHTVETVADNAEAVAGRDLVVLAVKPGVVPGVLAELSEAGVDRGGPLWISIAAGVTLATLEAGLGSDARIVRSMPNTPALVREGATAFCGNARAGADDAALARTLFEGVGCAWEAPREELLDAVTGLSGSGPAYVFALLEALFDAGEAAGLPRDAAELLALQTVYGAARLARESELGPAELRRRVSSPGGTTLAGLAALEDGRFAEALRAAVAAAAARARELGEGR